jgi:hypothetical protein
LPAGSDETAGSAYALPAFFASNIRTDNKGPVRAYSVEKLEKSDFEISRQKRALANTQ